MTCLKSHITTAAVTFVTVAVFFVPGLSDAMDLNPEQVSQGQLWRLFTGHLTHCGPSHLFWDLLMFIVLGGWLENRLGSRNYSLLLIFLGTALGGLLLFFLPERLVAYRGLSGIDSAFFAFVAGALAFDLRGGRRMVPMLMLLLYIIKSLLELGSGQAIFVADQSMVVVPLAHLFGAILGAVALAFARCFSPLGITGNNPEPKAV